MATVERIVAASAYRARSPFHRLPALPADLPPQTLGSGSIVFLVSDFLSFPADAVWDDAIARGWDVVPVVVQDPTWEQSFPAVGGATLPLADPDGRMRAVFMTRDEAERRRAENEARFASVLDRLEELGAEPITIGSADEDTVYDAFLAWAEGRRSTFTWTA